MTIYSRNAQVVGENTGITDKGIFNLFDAHQLVGLDSWGGNPEAFVVTALNETTVTLSGGTYKIFLGGGGGGGSSYSSEPGGLGGVFSFEANLAGGTYYAGVGAGGNILQRPVQMDIETLRRMLAEVEMGRMAIVPDLVLVVEDRT